jgi:hypothetical protein
MAKEVFWSFGVHVDAVAGWVVTYGGQTSLTGAARWASAATPTRISSAQDEDLLEKCIGLITRLTGQRPTGYAALWSNVVAAGT